MYFPFKGTIYHFTLAIYTFPSPGDLPDPGIEPRSPALQAELPGKSHL